VPAELAPFVSELATMAHAVKRIGCGPGEELAITGAGQTGIFGVAAARIAGVDRVISIDVDPQRLALARRLGADATINAREVDPVEAVRDLTGHGVSRAIEVVGSTHTIRQAIGMLAPRGVAGLIGTGTDIVLDLPDYPAVIGKEISLLGCLGKTNRDYALALSWVRQGRVDLSLLPVEIYDLSGFAEAFRAAERRDGRVVIEIMGAP
jgi:threonine dehydrogenase-like Zn-dependent dehydrogenase